MIDFVWPTTPQTHLVDLFALRLGYLPGYCNICGALTIFRVENENFREHVACGSCGSINRQRQLVAVLLSQLRNNGLKIRPLANLRCIPRDTVVWNTETTRALHHRLQEHLGKNYIGSEYLTPELRSGEISNGILHVDIQNTHFADESIDYILSGDVMEHVPNPLSALSETYRILRPNGCHIFTAPFYLHRFTNEIRARLDQQGKVIHLKTPRYHDDPIHSEGALVFNVFAPELLCQLETLGFDAKFNLLHSSFYGLLGGNGIVIVAQKVTDSPRLTDWIYPDANK